MMTSLPQGDQTQMTTTSPPQTTPPLQTATTTTDAIHRLLNPRRVAVVGASDDIVRIRGRVMHLLLKRGFDGTVFPVTPSRTEVQGIKAWARIGDIPGGVDLALIAVPASAVLGVLEDCAAAGVGAAVVYSSGFAEEGGAMAEVQARIATLCRDSGLRVIGPNAMGFYNLLSKTAATFSPAAEIAPVDLPAPDRGIAVVAQSGGLGFALYNRGVRRKLPFTHVVATGNEVDLEALDFADHLLDDPAVAQIMMFIEGVKNGHKLIPVAKKAARLGKPLIVAKVGRSAAAQRAAASHTASLTGSDAAYDAIFGRYGVIRADDQDEMIDIAAAFSVCPNGRASLPRGRRVAIVTSSGGSGSWMADAIEQAGLAVPLLSDALQARIRPVIPSYGATQNPVDITAQGLDAFDQVIEALASSPEADAVVIVAPLGSIGAKLPFNADALKTAIARAGKPVVFYSYTPPSPEMTALMAEVGTAIFTTLTGCAAALAHLVRYGEAMDRLAGASSVAIPAMDAIAGRAAQALDTLPRDGLLTEFQAKRLLAAAGIPVTEERLAGSAAEAVAAARALGGPMALKLMSPDLPHKTDAGAVLLNVQGDQAISTAYDKLSGPVAAALPDARIDGVLVQKMAQAGIEMIAGVMVDPDFGPLVMVGSGGIFVEILRDVAVSPAPVDHAEARRMIGRLKAAALLAGARGRPAADVEALADLLVRLSHLALATAGRVQEIDINPIFVHTHGLIAVDALARMEDTDTAGRGRAIDRMAATAAVGE